MHKTVTLNSFLHSIVLWQHSDLARTAQESQICVLVLHRIYGKKCIISKLDMNRTNRDVPSSATRRKARIIRQS